VYNGYIGEVVQAYATYFRCKTSQLTHNDFMSQYRKDGTKKCFEVRAFSLQLSRKSQNMK